MLEREDKRQNIEFWWNGMAKGKYK